MITTMPKLTIRQKQLLRLVLVTGVCYTLFVSAIRSEAHAQDTTKTCNAECLLKQIALAINSMQAWPDAQVGLRELWRVLKHGGIVALGFTANSGQPKQGVAERLAAAGFAHAQIVDRSKLFCAIASKP